MVGRERLAVIWNENLVAVTAATACVSWSLSLDFTESPNHLL